jgi:hypothetical protein
VTLETDFLQIINTYFRPILLLIGSIFTIYFAIQKIGNKVTARYEFSNSCYAAEHISKVVLSNKKDKTISIWSIYGIFESQYQYELKKFDPPIVLKPYDTISLSLPKYTSLNVNGDNYEPNFLFGNTSLYLDIGSGLLKCKKELRKDSLSSYLQITATTHNFNGHVYNGRLKYILLYNYDGKSHTAFIEKGGIINNEWEFSPNALNRNHVSAEAIKEMLVTYGFHDMFTNYACFEVDFPRTKLSFQKEPSKT